MNIGKLKFNDERFRQYLTSAGDGDSDAIPLPDKYDAITVQLSSIDSSAKVQYSLSRKSDVESDKAIWHDWSLGVVTSSAGIAFDSPVSFIRVVSSSTYTLEVLS
jgi:hypothetical protein